MTKRQKQYDTAFLLLVSLSFKVTVLVPLGYQTLTWRCLQYHIVILVILQDMCSHSLHSSHRKCSWSTPSPSLYFWSVSMTLNIRSHFKEWNSALLVFTLLPTSLIDWLQIICKLTQIASIWRTIWGMKVEFNERWDL